MLEELRERLRTRANPEKAAFFPRFFKTGAGQYGEGDLFLGVTVPDCRTIAKRFSSLPLKETVQLLHSKWHEERMVALFIWVLQYKKAKVDVKKKIFNAYLNNTARINNWDLVDLSSRDIVGWQLYDHKEQLPLLDKLAASPLLWERRIAIISTFYFIQKGDPAPTLRIAEQLLSDPHDLIQKANGWMLREVGKRIDRQILVDFIKQHYDVMPRTTLRYAIEHFPLEIRKQYLRGVFA